MKLSTLKSRLKGFGKTYNLTTVSGKEVPSQLITDFDNGRVFISYNSIIAIKYKGKIYLTDKWDYSATTSKYRNQFLNEGIADTREKIKSGIYKLVK